MKLKKDFVLRQVADTWVVLPVGQASVSFNGLMSLNGSGALLWQTLEKGSDLQGLADALVAEYEVDRETALADAEEFLATVRKAGCLEG